MNKLFSILIVSTTNRKPMLDNLLRFIKIQKTPEVEVLVCIDSKESSIGAKRNKLLREATGKYVSFVDDDDMISPYYVSSILNAAKNDADCIGLKGIITLKNSIPKLFIHSVKYDSWFEKDDVYYRFPNHLNPIKRELALDTMFPEISNQEDRAFSYKIKSKLKTETFIDTPLYYYYPSSEHETTN